jgi:hypothetical protein
VNQANSIFGYEVITMFIALAATKEKSLGTNFNQQNWMLVFRLLSLCFIDEFSVVHLPSQLYLVKLLLLG